MQKIWRIPLFRFVLFGTVLVLFDSVRPNDTEATLQRILVTRDQIAKMVTTWQQNWGTTPDNKEISALIQSYVEEEIYYREALALGLDQDDFVVRRRLRQKMEFLTENYPNAVDPTVDEVAAYYNQNIGKYSTGPRYDFEQVYFVEKDDLRIANAFASLVSGESGENLGDPSSLARHMTNVDEHDISRTFGSKFSDSLQALPNGSWSGPIPSGFGQHLVRVDKVQDKQPRDFSSVRELVEADWRTDHRKIAVAESFEKMRQNYTIEIEESK